MPLPVHTERLLQSVTAVIQRCFYESTLRPITAWNRKKLHSLLLDLIFPSWHIYLLFIYKKGHIFKDLTDWKRGGSFTIAALNLLEGNVAPAQNWSHFEELIWGRTMWNIVERTTSDQHHHHHLLTWRSTPTSLDVLVQSLLVGKFAWQVFDHEMQ